MSSSTLPAETAADTYGLAVAQLTKRYRGRVVVDDLSFEVAPGRITGFLGPNGSGKSTTMKMLLDLAAADHGTATIGGLRYRDLPNPAGTVGVVLEPNAFHPGRTGRNHLRVLARAAGLPVERVDETLAAVGLDPAAGRRRVGTYSLGMKQRLSLAAALLTDPPVLVLDEPANGLDPQGIRELRELLRARAERGHTVLVSSHLLTEVEHVVDDVVVINRGRLVTSGSVDELTSTRAFVRTPEPDRLGKHLLAAGAQVEFTGDGTIDVSGLELAEIGDVAHTCDVVVHELSRHASSLEDVFFTLTTTAPTTQGASTS